MFDLNTIKANFNRLQGSVTPSQPSTRDQRGRRVTLERRQQGRRTVPGGPQHDRRVLPGVNVVFQPNSPFHLRMNNKSQCQQICLWQGGITSHKFCHLAPP